MIAVTVSDFNQYLEFALSDKVVLSKATLCLGKVDLFELNQFLIHKRHVDQPNFNQSSYVFIDFMYWLALDGELVKIISDERKKFRFTATPLLAQYYALNNEEKYTFLLQTFWTKYAFNDRYTGVLSANFCEKMLKWIGASSKTSIIKLDDKRALLASACSLFLQHLQFFGLVEVTISVTEKIHGDRYKTTICRLENGDSIAQFLLGKARHLWHYDDPFELQDPSYYKRYSNQAIFKVFQLVLDKNKVKRTIRQVDMKQDQTNDKAAKSSSVLLKVRLKYNKSIWRELALNRDSCFSALHQGIQEAFDFDDDHLYCFDFKVGVKKPIKIGLKNDWYADLLVNKTKLSDMCHQIGQTFEYLFDFGDEWYFEIEVLSFGDEKIDPKQAEIRKRKGKSPDQYR